MLAALTPRTPTTATAGTVDAAALQASLLAYGKAAGLSLPDFSIDATVGTATLAALQLVLADMAKRYPTGVDAFGNSYASLATTNSTTAAAQSNAQMLAATINGLVSTVAASGVQSTSHKALWIGLGLGVLAVGGVIAAVVMGNRKSPGRAMAGLGKVYIVYVNGNEVGTIQAGSHNAAEKKAQKKYPGKQVMVAYTEV